MIEIKFFTIPLLILLHYLTYVLLNYQAINLITSFDRNVAIECVQ